jgi:hypothetical protein
MLRRPITRIFIGSLLLIIGCIMMFSGTVSLPDSSGSDSGDTWQWDDDWSSDGDSDWDSGGWDSDSDWDSGGWDSGGWDSGGSDSGSWDSGGSDSGSW